VSWELPLPQETTTAHQDSIAQLAALSLFLAAQANTAKTRDSFLFKATVQLDFTASLGQILQHPLMASWVMHALEVFTVPLALPVQSDALLESITRPRLPLQSLPAFPVHLVNSVISEAFTLSMMCAQLGTTAMTPLDLTSRRAVLLESTALKVA